MISNKILFFLVSSLYLLFLFLLSFINLLSRVFTYLEDHSRPNTITMEEYSSFLTHLFGKVTSETPIPTKFQYRKIKPKPILVTVLNSMPHPIDIPRPTFNKTSGRNIETIWIPITSFVRDLDKANPSVSFTRRQYQQAWYIAVKRCRQVIVDAHLCWEDDVEKELERHALRVRIHPPYISHLST